MRIGIIGGGVYGVTTAYFLKRLGAEEVLLFEKDAIASGSTGYSAGIVRHHYSNAIQVKMATRGREILENIEEYIGHDGGFVQNGYLILTNAEKEEAFRRTVTLQQDLGIDVELVAPGELTDYLPGIDPSDVEIGAFERDAGFADPYLVTTGFADAARDLGAEILTQTPVTDVTMDGKTATTIETDTETFPVDYVVNAAGPWGKDVGEMVGVDLPLKQYESKIAVLKSTTPYGPDLPTLSDHSVKPDMYTKPETAGEFLVGGIDRPPVDPGRGLEGVTNEFLRTVGERIDQRLPGYSDSEVVESWSGTITVTPDAIQIAGVPNGIENVYNIVGGSGHGFKEATAFAESIAQTILGLEVRVPLDPYRLERFTDGGELTGISTETYSDS